jgi:hypothetical protein
VELLLLEPDLCLAPKVWTRAVIKYSELKVGC